MFIDLLKMMEEERTSLYLQSTYFNIHFNRTRKYRSVFTALSALFHKKDNELWCLITNTARAIKHGAKGMQIPRSYPAYNNNVQRIVHGNMCVLLAPKEYLLNNIDDIPVRYRRSYLLSAITACTKNNYTRLRCVKISTKPSLYLAGILPFI